MSTIAHSQCIGRISRAARAACALAVTVACAAAPAGLARGDEPRASGDRPNIIYIMADEHGHRSYTRWIC